MACAVVVGDDRCDTVVKAEYRHEEKALQFKVNAKYSSCSYCKVHQDQIHGIGHDRADGLHVNGWNTYCINMSDDLRLRAESTEAETDFMIEFMVAEPGNDAGYALADHCGGSSTCYAHFRSTEKTEDQDRVKNDVCDGTAELGSHAENSFSSGCKQSFKEELTEKTKGKDHDCAQVFDSEFHDLRIGTVQLAGIKRAYHSKSENQKYQIA